ncbi:PREDICTED: mitochondrial import inner membrane translocase subunit TIM50-C-like [Nicrophorus vespilloides]|uniref:Mitochondrial import inner membrane translocase subunit TIM50 n=1 Tax=Nicrophorus vespilloides TaxID=110193 RepID=A0ABM1NBR5_NICVS|nr:PREDICTED: mitochondrial import inner membrane translocase subunit TIM50-C-like [Nicrophorus vespilloides]
MFRVTPKALTLFNNILKNPKNVILCRRECNGLMTIQNSYVQKAFFSSQIKDGNAPKSPLATLFAKGDGDKKKEEQTPPDENSQKETKEQSWRRMKYTLAFFGISFTCIGGYLIMELGKPRIGLDGLPLEDPYSDMPKFKQYILRTINELNYYKQLIKEPSRDKLLPDMIKHPYYAPKYTLVLEFTDVIVHPEWTYNTGWRFKKRPGLDHFLESLNGVFEIVVYTAEQGMTVFPIIEALDPKNHINYKLVRDATLFIDGRHVKDLDKLNRELEKTIVVDWDGKSTNHHPENVFQIPRWKGNDDDMTLFHLSSFLLAISQNQIDDIREVVKYYNQFDDALATFREKQKQLIELAEEAASAPKPQSPVNKWTPNFFKRNF